MATWVDDITRHLDAPLSTHVDHGTRRAWVWAGDPKRAVGIEQMNPGRYETQVYGPEGNVKLGGSREPSDETMRFLCTAVGLLPMPGQSRPDGPDVRVGQVWASCDKREQGRHVKVTAIAGDKAVVVGCDQRGVVHGTPRPTRLSIRRMRPTSTGFRLHIDVPKETT